MWYYTVEIVNEYLIFSKINMKDIQLESAIRTVIKASVDSYASGFSDRHISEYDNPNGTINMKIHNVFISILGDEIKYYTALVRSLDSSLGNMLEKMAINIAELQYEVTQSVEGYITNQQVSEIAKILEEYRRRERVPSIEDYKILTEMDNSDGKILKRHDSDYYLFDKEADKRYLIELKIGGDLDNKKARSEKEALLEQYCILSNSLPNEDILLKFATAYNRFGEDKEWKQERVKQFFAKEELLIGKDFWNLICMSEDGYRIVIEEYSKNAHKIREALEEIKSTYLKDE
jgi:hypothetical protein